MISRSVYIHGGKKVRHLNFYINVPRTFLKIYVLCVSRMPLRFLSSLSNLLCPLVSDYLFWGGKNLSIHPIYPPCEFVQLYKITSQSPLFQEIKSKPAEYLRLPHSLKSLQLQT